MRPSIRWQSSPRRMAPAIRALPFRVCSRRRSAWWIFSSAGLAFHSRRSAPISGTICSASSTKIGSSCASMSSRITRFSRPSGGRAAGGVTAARRAASRRVISARSAVCCGCGEAGASPRRIDSTMPCRLVTAACTVSPSFGSVVSPAKPVHCSSAADRSASGAKPAVREVLDSVCAARMKSGEASAGCAARHALHCASSTAMCSAASLV